MYDIPLQPTSYEVWMQKYQLKNAKQEPVDETPDDTLRRVARALAEQENEPDKWEELFYDAMKRGATPAGRILANAGAFEYKSGTSTINCTVSTKVGDSMEGILDAVKEAGVTLSAGCGIGYEFSTLRPRGSFVQGAGANTSGPLSFMDIFDSMCFTVSSAGGRRGAQMATFAVWHPDVKDFIQAKRQNGRLRQFNVSLLIDDEFMEAVKSNSEYPLVFPMKQSEINKGVHDRNTETYHKKRMWDLEYCKEQDYIIDDNDNLVCKVYERVNARDLWNTIMVSTYDFAEPGFLLIDRINEMNPNYFCENIRATNPCG